MALHTDQKDHIHTISASCPLLCEGIWFTDEHTYPDTQGTDYVIAAPIDVVTIIRKLDVIYT